jgi:hypothetical protein
MNYQDFLLVINRGGAGAVKGVRVMSPADSSVEGLDAIIKGLVTGSSTKLSLTELASEIQALLHDWDYDVVRDYAETLSYPLEDRLSFATADNVEATELLVDLPVPVSAEHTGELTTLVQGWLARNGLGQIRVDVSADRK